MPDDMWRPLQDILVVAYMFVLRVGVPVMIIWAIGAVLAKILQGSEREAEADHAGLETAQYCWDIKRCLDSERAQCPAFHHPELPCWLAFQQNGEHLPEICFTCPLFVATPLLAGNSFSTQPAAATQGLSEWNPGMVAVQGKQ